MSRCGHGLTLLAVLLVAGPTRADDSEEAARVHFDAGSAYYAEGDWASAATEFERAYEATPMPAFLNNLYLCYERLGQFEEAADRLRRYLASAETLDDREALERRLEDLERRVRESRAPAPAETATPAEGGTPLGGILLVSAGGAAAVTGIVLVALAASDVSSVENAEDGTRWSQVEAAYGRSEGRSIAGAILLAAGAAAAGVGVVLLFSTDAEASAGVSVGPGAIAVRGRF